MTHPNPSDYARARASVASMAKHAPGFYLRGKVEAYADARRPATCVRRYDRPIAEWLLNQRRIRECSSPYDLSSRATYARACLYVRRYGHLTLADRSRFYGTLFPSKAPKV